MKDVEFPTLTHGYLPGTRLRVDLTLRDIDITGLITSVSARFIFDSYWLYTVKATGADTVTVYQGSHLDQWRQLLGGQGSGSSGGGGAVVVATPTSAVTTTTLAASPVYLGGSLNTSLPCGTTPTEVVNRVPYKAPVSFTPTVRVQMRARTGSPDPNVLASIYTEAGAFVDQGTVKNGTSLVTDEFTVAMTEGQTYVLRVQGGDAAGDVYAIGQLA
jgi:hypothetical protein